MTIAEYKRTLQIDDVAKELTEKLKRFSEDDEFVYGILVDAKTDEERKQVIQYIDYGENVSYENIILYALKIAQSRKRKSEIN